MQTSYVVLKRFFYSLVNQYLDQGDVFVFTAETGTVAVYRASSLTHTALKQTVVGVQAMERTGLIKLVVEHRIAPAVPEPVKVEVATTPPPPEAIKEPVVEVKAEVAPLEPKAETTEPATEPAPTAPELHNGLTREALIAQAKEEHGVYIHPNTGFTKVVEKITTLQAAKAEEAATEPEKTTEPTPESEEKPTEAEAEKAVATPTPAEPAPEPSVKTEAAATTPIPTEAPATETPAAA